MPFMPFLFTSLFTIWSAAAWASPYRRLVNFEWEAIESARSYEVEIRTAKGEKKEKVFSFKVQNAKWNGRLSPGKYLMKLRSLDRRGVPGDWSAPSEFNVGLENVTTTYPASKAQISSPKDNEATVHFKWAPVGGAEFYRFELLSEDGKTQVLDKIRGTSLRLTVPAAMNYNWKISAQNEEGFQSDNPTMIPFTVMGPTLPTPQITPVENDFVREISWDPSGPPHTQYDVTLTRLNENSNTWEKVKVLEGSPNTSVTIEDSLPGGQYQVVIRANAPLYPASPPTTHKFRVRDGDRSPAAEYSATIRKSIERVEGWYGIASYLITEMNFKGKNPEMNSSSDYNALGGTGRLGLGWFKPENAWGFLGIIDMSGFSFQGKSETFASVEVNSVYRINPSERSEIRVQLGAYFKELPESVGDPLSGASQNLKYSAMGPHLGAEFWYSLSPKFGLQINSHLYYSALKINTPNGQELNPTLSSQFGFLGSYRFSPGFTGLLGYARREDRLAYKARSGGSSFAAAGDINESTIVGNYLNFFAEWAF